MKPIVCALAMGLLLPSFGSTAIMEIQVSNNTFVAVTISWTTDSNVQGEVHYSENPDLSNAITAYDVRGQFVSGCIHYVEIAGLTKETTYYFEVVAGGETDNNGGNYYTFRTTKEPLFPPSPCFITGCVYEEDGITLAVGPIVYLWITHGGVESYPLSDLLSDDDATPGCFAFDIKQARSTVTNDLFPSIDPGDPIRVMAIDCGNSQAESNLGFEGCFRDIGSLTLPPSVNDDADEDGVTDEQDNCPQHPNGPLLGTCSVGTVGTACMSNQECDSEFVAGFCSMNQDDTYPPQGNGIGDACDCESNFDCDGDVDTFDMVIFLNDFGRNSYADPCTSGNPCSSDFSCDGDVDTFDMVTFLEDFGRGFYVNPCPACEVGDWCVYP